MKVPKIFMPDKDLIEKIEEYMGDSLSERISKLHEDPNLSYVAPSVIIASAIQKQGKIPTNVLEMAMEKEILTLDNFLSGEIKAKNIPQGEILRIIRKFIEISESKGGKCMFAGDFFKASELVISEYISNKDLEVLKESYFEKIKRDIVRAVTDAHPTGTVAYRTLKEDNEDLYDKVIKNMEKSGYCKTCACKTLEYFCTPRYQR